MAKQSYGFQIGAIVLGGILIATGYGAGLGAYVINAGIGLAVSGGIGLAVGLISARGQDGLEDSATYSATRPTNHRGDGEPIPFVFGEHRQTPLAIHTSLESGGKGDHLKRVYLLGYGEMEVYFPSDDKNASHREKRDLASLLARIRVNDLPITEIDPNAYAEIHHTTAGADLGKIARFNHVGRPFTQSGTKLDRNVEHLYEMKAEADGVDAIFDFPNGLLKVDSGGKQGQSAGGVRFEYRELGSEDSWKRVTLGGTKHELPKKTQPPFRGIDGSLPAPPVTPFVPDGVSLEDWKAGIGNKDWQPTVRADNLNKVVKGQYYTTGNQRTYVRRVAKIQFPQRGQYELRFTGLTSDDQNDIRAPHMTSIVEMTAEPVTTKEGLTLLAIDFETSDQIRGGDTVLTIDSRGVKIPKLEDSNAVGVTDNAASVAHYLMLHPAGMGLWYGESEIDSGVGGSWIDKAVEIENETHTLFPRKGGVAEVIKAGRCNLVVDTRGAASDWMNSILALMHAWTYEVEGLMKLSRDSARSVTRVFETRKNESDPMNVLVNDDGTSTLDARPIPFRDRYNAFIVEFIDPEDGWEQRKTKKIKESDAVGDTVAEKLLTIFVPGITSLAQAIQHAHSLMVKTKESLWMASWGCSWADLDVAPGQRVTVNCDWMGWPSDTKDFDVLGMEFAPDGTGIISGREYTGASQHETSNQKIVNAYDKVLNDAAARIKAQREADGTYTPASTAKSLDGASGGYPNVGLSGIRITVLESS